MSIKQKVVTIGGPSASGKGIAALHVAQALGFDYLDSGALYRLTTLYAEKRGVGWYNGKAVAQLAENLPVRFEETRTMLNDEDVPMQIRSEAIGMGVSAIAQLPKMHAALLQRQRDLLTEEGLVADGRDMGSIVFHDAVLKVFLAVSAQIRVQRRARQFGLPCEGVKFDRILSDIEAGDEANRRRFVAPLRQLPDAALLDTTNLGIRESVKKMLDWYHKSQHLSYNCLVLPLSGGLSSDEAA